jgi:Calcineurin-like phosphoesterase
MKNTMKMFAAITLMVVAVANTASAQNSWSFVMLGDTRDDNNTSTGISPYLNTIAQKIASLNPQLVIVDGDLCNGDALNTYSHWYPADGNFTNAAMKATYAGFFANWKTAMQPIFNYSTGTGIPIYTVRGNHENEDVETATIEVLKQAYQEAFSAYVPTNGPNNGLTDDERGFSWSLTTNNVTFVAADQYFNFDPTVTNTTPWSGYHYLDQAWVTQQLKQATSPYKIFIAHEPIFQTEGNGPNEEENGDAQHFFGTNSVALQTRANFWNAIGDAGAQLYLAGHIHLETVASTTNDRGHTIIQLMAGNGGAPPQPFIDGPEPGVTIFYNNGNIFTNGSVQATFGFALATVTDEKMTIHYYSLTPTNNSPTTNSWTVADYVTQIASARARPIISLPFDPRAGTFSYTRQDPAGTGLSYRIYTNTTPDLSAWSVDAAATQTVTGITNNLQTVQVTLSGTKPLNAPKLFIRVVAQ